MPELKCTYLLTYLLITIRNVAVDTRVDEAPVILWQRVCRCRVAGRGVVVGVGLGAGGGGGDSGGGRGCGVVTCSPACSVDSC